MFGMAEEECLPAFVPIIMTSMTCSTCGLQLFHGSKRRELLNFVAIAHYFVILVMIACSVITVLMSPEKTEEAILILIFLAVSFGVFLFLRKNISQIERIFNGIECCLSEKDHAIIRKTDLWINLVPYVAVTLSMIAAAAAVVYFRSSIHQEVLKTGFMGNSTEWTSAALAYTGFLLNMKAVYSIIYCSIQIYTMVMVVFECMAQNLKSDLRKKLVEGATKQAISEIRTQLRFYWTWKQKADKYLNVFPFTWAVYLFLTVSLILTKLISQWQPHSFLTISMFFSALVTVSLISKWHLFTAPDKTMDDCMRLAFSLTDPRMTGKLGSEDVQLNHEIFSLHLEIVNAPKTYSTILGAVRLNFETLISYVGALINFAVMVINIRMAVK